MATGVKPRDEDTQLTRSDLETIQDALKQKKFRDLLAEYCEEVRDPANQALYQKEMVQLEKERGYDIKFINPKGGYVIKTSVAGDRKAFINICSNENVGKPSYQVQEVNGKRGMNWLIPYSLTPPREDFDGKNQRCVIYDVVFHPNTVRMAEANKQFREVVNKTAFDGLQMTYNIHLDNNNSRFPKSYYKGIVTPSVIRKEDPDYKPPPEEECEHLTQDMMEKLYPQKNYSESNDNKETVKPNQHYEKPRKTNKIATEFSHKSEEGYTIPKYLIKQQKNVDFQEFTYHRDSKQHSAIPSHLVIEINLPLLSSTSDCVLDVQEKFLRLISEKPAKYKLEIPLPYPVNDECGRAKFDKSKSKLFVTLPVIRKNLTSDKNSSLKVDSGVESEEYSGSQSEDECSNLIVELPSTSTDFKSNPSPSVPELSAESDSFFERSLGYMLPTYTHNVLDDIVAFTFHVKNTEPDSVKVKNIGNKVCIKFTSIGSGFVPVHYAASIIFDENIHFGNASGEAWDNNVILQLELAGVIPQKFQIGLCQGTMTSEYFDVSQITKSPTESEESSEKPEDLIRSVEVTNLGSQTNIVVSSNHDEEYDEDDDSPTDEKDIVWMESNSDHNAKSILRKPISMMRSFSESSTGDVASSIDYISSDCIPEESSLKKTVRFNDVISKQFYRYNSSIEGQKKKNQRKKSKKRSQDRRKSESEAEDDVLTSIPTSKPKKPVLKQRRDSGLADTSDGDTDFKNTPDERSFVTPTESNNTYANTQSIFNIIEKNDELSTDDANPRSNPNVIDKNYEQSYDNPTENNDTDANPQSIFNIIDKNDEAKEKPESGLWESSSDSKITCGNIEHKTDLYNPDKLNKGQYLDVMFKNDLIFDLDM